MSVKSNSKSNNNYVSVVEVGDTSTGSPPPPPPTLPKFTAFSASSPESMRDDEGSKSSSTSASPSPTIPGLVGKGSDQEPILNTSDRLEKHRKQEDEVVGMSCGSSFCCGFLMLVAEILLFGITALVFFWIMYFHSSVEDGAVRYFTWRSDPEYKAKLGFNLHPVLMIVGFIFLSGQAMLMYRLCRCCRRIWNKLLHALLHLMAMPCIAISFVAVLDSHDLRTIKDKDGNIVNAPIPNFYSLHSWMGLFTMGLFGLQYIAGFFSFLLLLCCESATSSFRASMVPIHSIFGIATFVMAVATACSGLIEKAFFTLSIAYSKWVPYLFDPNFNATTALTNLEETLGPVYTDKMFQEAMVINVLGLSLVLLAVVMTFVVMFPKFRQRPSSLSIVVAHDRYG